MGNSDYLLLEIDKSEASLVRQRLHRWSEFDEQLIRPLIMGLSDFQVMKPRFVTNVYPLYYWACKEAGRGGERAYQYVLGKISEFFPDSNSTISADDRYSHLKHIMDSEIDILVEDRNYFIFVEAKIPQENRKVAFQNRSIHQLVRQYIQGKILGNFIGKEFAFGTIGANNAVMNQLVLTDIEQKLLCLIGEERNSLDVRDLAWSIIPGESI